ncbi:MAG: hypothetical protein R3A51_15670 [Nannocystaceae bacterium]
MLGGGEHLEQIDRPALEALLVGVLDQQLAVADDRVQRRAQLVAHVGQEGALGLVGRLSGGARLGQLALADLGLRELLREPGAQHLLDLDLLLEQAHRLLDLQELLGDDRLGHRRGLANSRELLTQRLILAAQVLDRGRVELLGDAQRFTTARHLR